MNNNLNMNNDSQQNQNNLSNNDIIKFKHNIKNWLDIDSKILELQSEIKQTNVHKMNVNELQNSITILRKLHSQNILETNME